jgi:hypothetical protein
VIPLRIAKVECACARTAPFNATQAAAVAMPACVRFPTAVTPASMPAMQVPAMRVRTAAMPGMEGKHSDGRSANLATHA